MSDIPRRKQLSMVYEESNHMLESLQDEKYEEENLILSLPSYDALKYTLCGISEKELRSLNISENSEIHSQSYCKPNSKKSENADTLDDDFDHDSVKNSQIDRNDYIDLNHSDDDMEKTDASSEHSNQALPQTCVNEKHSRLNIPSSDSTSYLQDYLHILTSRSLYNRVKKGKVKDLCENQNEIDIASNIPILDDNFETKNDKSCSSSSDLSSTRSVGSTYLDSYLGGLTDHSWIMYPSKSSSSEQAKSLSKSTDLYRRLHFVNPEMFFNIPSSRKKDTSGISLDTVQHTLNDNMNERNCNLDSTVNMERNSLKDICLNSPMSIETSESTLNLTLKNQYGHSNSISIENVSSEFQNETSKETIIPSQNMKEDAIEDSSLCSTNDQVSVIPCDEVASINELNENRSQVMKNSNSTSTVNSEDTANGSSLSQQSLTNSLDVFTEGSSIVQAVNILRSKQAKEIEDLQRKQKDELDLFMLKLSQLSRTQSFTNDISLESPNVNVKPLQEISSGNETHVSSPSFFLHGEDKENSLSHGKQNDVSKISQLFTSCKYPSYNQKSPQFHLREQNGNSIPYSSLPPTNNQKDCKLSNAPRRVTFSPRSLEIGLDILPSKEDYINLPPGFIKLQALIRGKRIRRLMLTSKVQDLLDTLVEVAKMAHQFHQDILTDNIHKGDIGFHRSLINQERQARETLHHILVEASPKMQIEIIYKDSLIDKTRRPSTDRIRKSKSTSDIKMKTSSLRGRIPQLIPQSSSQVATKSPKLIESKQNKSLHQSSQKQNKSLHQSSQRSLKTQIPTHNSSALRYSKKSVLQKLASKPDMEKTGIKRQNIPICKTANNSQFQQKENKTQKKTILTSAKDSKNDKLKKLWR